MVQVLVNKKRKVEKCPWSVAGQRESAHMHIRAMDKQLELTTGQGLSQFGGGEDDAKEVARQFLEEDVIPLTFCLHLDQGSLAYCMTWLLIVQRGFF